MARMQNAMMQRGTTVDTMYTQAIAAPASADEMVL